MPAWIILDIAIVRISFFLIYCTRILKGWHLSKKLSTFPKNSPKYLLMKELDSYCGTIDNTIYAYVKNYLTCSDIFS